MLIVNVVIKKDQLRVDIINGALISFIYSSLAVSIISFQTMSFYVHGIICNERLIISVGWHIEGYATLIQQLTDNEYSYLTSMYSSCRKLSISFFFQIFSRCARYIEFPLSKSRVKIFSVVKSYPGCS